MEQETSRRGFLGASGIALAAARLSAFQQKPGDKQLFAYVGKHSTGSFAGGPPGKEGGVNVYRVNMSDGSLTEVSRTGSEADGLNSDGMCVSADHRFLYSINVTPSLEGKAGAGGGVSAFAINPQDGSLRYLNAQPSMGGNPTAVIIDKTNSRVVVANHGAVNKIALIKKKNGVPYIESPTDDGTVALFPVKPDGSLEPACDVSVFEQRPLSEPGPGAACHSVIFDRTGRWIIASDNGYDHIYVFPFNPASRELKAKSFATPPGRAPRHFAVHPRAPYFFMVNEREASLSSFHFDSDKGDVSPVQTIATVPDGYSGPRVAPTDIRIHPNAKFVYSANRGDDSVAVFAIDDATGRLTRVEVVKTGGQGPREINIDPSGKFLFSCNLQSNDVTTLALDGNTGKMTQTAKIGVQRAAVIDFATL